jgi:hypothetical protein
VQAYTQVARCDRVKARKHGDEVTFELDVTGDISAAET